MQKSKVPVYGSDYGDALKCTPLPEFSEINFQKILAKCCANGMLQAHYGARLGCDLHLDRVNSVLTTEKIHSINKPVLEPKSIPIQIKSWRIEGVLKREENSFWTSINYYAFMKRDIAQITDSVLNDLFPVGNEHSRVRDMELVKA